MMGVRVTECVDELAYHTLLLTKSTRRGKGSHVVLYCIVRYEFAIDRGFLLQQLCTCRTVESRL